jgi:hypothetical protein
MNENDKILINAYLDGESSIEDLKYIEALLDSNKEANEYANAIKRANTEINTFFNNEEIKDLESNLSSFLNNLKFDKNKSSSLNSFNKFFKPRLTLGHVLTASGKFFTPQSFAGYALTASVVYFLMLPISKDFTSDGLFPSDFSTFSAEINSYDFEIYRGAEDLGDEIKNNFINSINNMIESKIFNSIMRYGEESYFIKIDNLAINEELIFCLDGNILNNGIKTEFLFCKSLTDETITYLN